MRSTCLTTPDISYWINSSPPLDMLFSHRSAKQNLILKEKGTEYATIPGYDRSA
jgi:hypothetical protein